MLSIATTRFNQDTWEENQSYRSKKQILGCIYGIPKRLSETIPVKTCVAVFEMNNSTNTIMGIGLIVNYLRMDIYYKIYSDCNYNRYVYKSKYRIDKNEFKDNELPFINYFENLLFCGKGHLKRGHGITQIPYKKIKKYTFENISAENYILEMFRRRFL